MHHQKFGARAEYRRRENQRVNDAPTLAERFTELKSLKLDLAHFGPEDLAPSSQLTYTVNLTHAKSVIRFDCPNQDCVGGDFDLSAVVANVVAAHKVTLNGKMICQGWRSKTTIDKVACGHILRYQLTVGY